ncbi:hypothetical protein QA601_15145 [Chitinispirillales bacterium ANBcel5]|uniref:hypothetical protein n=1 Tax=Cellulosispirillum alkaliphilum TaxID=3039283 RepID=UPI002A587F45|nr:hypothetical protein [Chitinispirillales bacterium ANBcel5]
MKKATLLILFLITLAYPFFSPRYYQITGILVTQRRPEGDRSRGFNLQSLYFRIDNHSIKVYGRQTGKTIEEEFEVSRTVNDTLYIRPDHRMVQNEYIKLHFSGDTIYSNNNFLTKDGPSGNIEVIMSVRELDARKDRAIIELF